MNVHKHDPGERMTCTHAHHGASEEVGGQLGSFLLSCVSLGQNLGHQAQQQACSSNGSHLTGPASFFFKLEDLNLHTDNQ